MTILSDNDRSIAGPVVEGLLRGFQGGDGMIRLTQTRGSNPSALIILDGVQANKVRFFLNFHYTMIALKHSAPCRT